MPTPGYNSSGYAGSEEEARRKAEELGGTYRGEDGGSHWYDYSTEPGASDGENFDEAMGDVPVLGWLFGSNARNARRDAERRAAEEQARTEGAWGPVRDNAPTARDLQVQYGLEGSADEYGDLQGGESALAGMDPHRGQTALRALEGLIASGGYTSQDQAQTRAQRLAQGQQLRGANEAAIQQMQARGMGGSGAELAARLSGSQSYANANAMSDATIQSQAMQRALQAMQAQGSLSSTMYGQEAARRSALDDFNARNMDWRRQRESRNTAWANRTRDSRSSAKQQAWQNQADAAAGYTGQYSRNRSQDAAERNAANARQDQADQAGAGVIGGIISEIL